MPDVLITSKEEALCQLFLHCCYKDGEFKEKELDFVAGLFVELDLHTALNFKNEIVKYNSTKSSILDEAAYLSVLLKQINPVHEYALYSYCAEILLCDASLEIAEEKLLLHLATALDISTESQEIIKKLVAQRKAIELDKIF
jgi:uncharacterized tellurite resistance protein B-like protein